MVVLLTHTFGSSTADILLMTDANTEGLLQITYPVPGSDDDHILLWLVGRGGEGINSYNGNGTKWISLIPMDYASFLQLSRKEKELARDVAIRGGLIDLVLYRQLYEKHLLREVSRQIRLKRRTERAERCVFCGAITDPDRLPPTSKMGNSFKRGSSTCSVCWRAFYVEPHQKAKFYKYIRSLFWPFIMVNVFYALLFGWLGMGGWLRSDSNASYGSYALYWLDWNPVDWLRCAMETMMFYMVLGFCAKCFDHGQYMWERWRSGELKKLF